MGIKNFKGFAEIHSFEVIVLTCLLSADVFGSQFNN